MKDGSVRDSIEGVVIPNKEFYQILQGIIEKRGGADVRRVS
jgi:hypothetical protein